VQVFLSNQTIKLKQRSLLLLIEEEADGMHQNEAQQAIAQMPQIACPDPLHLTPIRQLTKDRVDEITNPSQDGTLVGWRLWRMRFAKWRLQDNAFGSQEGLQIRKPIIAITQPTPVVPSNRRRTISPSDSLAGARYKRVSGPGQLNCTCNRKP
jgi:hypothetical protein